MSQRISKPVDRPMYPPILLGCSQLCGCVLFPTPNFNCVRYYLIFFLLSDMRISAPQLVPFSNMAITNCCRGESIEICPNDALNGGEKSKI